MTSRSYEFIRVQGTNFGFQAIQFQPVTAKDGIRQANFSLLTKLYWPIEMHKSMDYSGYWVGHFAGTNVGGFTLVIRQNGSKIEGVGTFDEPAVGVYKLFSKR